MECFGDIESYGRRRKRSAADYNSTTDSSAPTTANRTSYFKITLPLETTEPTHTANKTKEEIYTNALDNDKISRERRHSREPRFLPEKVDLGLRLTVGEEVNQKPFLPSSLGEGHFPESSPYTSTEPGAGGGPNVNNAAYYPALNSTSKN